MIFTKALKYQDIIKNIDIDHDVITIIGCETCVRVAGSGGEQNMKEMAMKLRSEGYNVKDGFMVPSSCTPKVLFAKLSKDVNTIISLACCAGTSNIMRCFPEYKIIETTENIGLMVTDTDKNILKVTMPYENHEDELGMEYDFYTGNKRDINNTLLMTEVGK